MPESDAIAIRADDLFPTASTIKIAIVCALFDRIARGELRYDEPLVYDAARAVPGEDVLASFRDGETITVARLVHLMLSMSDNTASVWLQELAGTGTAINGWLEAHGFEETRVNSRTPGREEAYEEFGWGQTTPRELARLLTSIYEGEVADSATTDEMIRVLGRSWYDGEALSAIPPTLHTISKQGAVDRARSEVVVVNAPTGPYVLCVMTKNQADTSWSYDNAGFMLVRDVSREIWLAMAPDEPYEPPDRRPWWKNDVS